MGLSRISLARALLALLLTSVHCQAEDKFFDSDGVRIRYVERGSGEAVVLLHGDPSTLDLWTNTGVLPQLAENYRVIAFDARGSGVSGKPHDVKAYGRELGLDVIRLLDHLQIQRAHIVGYSMGAHITAQLLTTHAERFLSATLAGAAGRFNWTEDQERRAEQEASERERDCVSRSQIYRLAPTNAPTPDEAAISKMAARCMANPTMDRFARAARTRAEKDLAISPAEVMSVKIRTLGVVGSLDGYLSDFTELKKLRPRMRLVVIEGATHGGPRGIVRRSEFLEAVYGFLSTPE